MSRTSAYLIKPRLGLKFSVLLIQAFIAWSIALSQPCSGQTIIPYTQDPAGYGIGFARAHWANSVSKMVVFFGSTRPASDDNSIRAFDPVTNSWEYLWSNGPFNGGLQTRDNHASFYVPRLDELWVWGGSHLETLPGALRSGRFSIAQKKWITTSTDDNGAFSAVVKNFDGFLIDPAMAWSEQADTGLMFGGSDGGNASNRYWIIEPNPPGPQPYKMSEIIGGVRPPPRAEAMNLMVAAGSDFYLLGGDAGSINGQTSFATDLWKFNSATRTWTQLPSPPNVGYTPTLTYDSDRNALVAWVNEKIYVFDLARQQWSDQTPAGLPCVFNQVGIYAPSAKIHLFEGGNKCADGNSAGPTVYAISLGTQALTSLAPPPPSPLTSPQPATSGPAGYTFCANENQTCSFNGQKRVAYGANNNFTFLNLTGGTTCTNAVFGDPIFGTVKACYTIDITTQTPSPTSTPIPTPAPTLALAATSVALLAPASSQPDLPLRTWVAVPFSSIPGGAPCKDGPGCKHLSPALDLTNDRIYNFGGDWSVLNGNPLSNPSPSIEATARNEIWSLGLQNNNWRLEYPYCGFSGDVTVGRPTEVGVAWDSTRKKFWILPGYEGLGIYPWPCSSGATPSNAILTFDPATQKFSQPSVVSQPWQSELPKNAEYDPVTDSIWRVGNDGRGIVWGQYHIATNTWDVYQTVCASGTTVDSSGPCAGNGTYVNDVKLGFEHFALDPSGQAIYIIDPKYYRLFRFDLVTHSLKVLATPPPINPAVTCAACLAGHTITDWTWLVWDSVNNILFYPFIPSSTASGNDGLSGYPTLAIYHPDTDTWEVDPMNQPNGLKVRGNAFLFNPIDNALISIGGCVPNGCGNDLSLQYYFLYRYGNGNGQPYVPPTPVVTPPLAPTPIASPPTQTPDAGPAGYSFCASENQTCSFSGQKSVAYGANNNFAFLNLAGGTACTNSVFGDPISGTVKACYIKDILTQAPAPASGPVGYTFCATENQTCSFTGQKSVAYGANNNFTMLNLSGGTECTNSVFGDPIFGTVKACYIKDVPAQVPATPVATDTTPPSVLIVSPSANASVSNIVTGKITATDNVGIAKIELYKDGVLVGTTTSSPYNFDWDTTKDSNGAHTLIAMAYDGSANRASAVISVNVDNTKEISIVLQDGLNSYSGTQDTYLYYYYHWLNFGSADELLSGEGGGSYSMLVRQAIFESEGGAIPQGAVIKSATLSLYKYSPYDQIFQANRLLRDWREMEASWDNANTTTHWSVNGAFGSDTDAVAEADGQGFVGWDPGWLEIDVTSGVQAMSNGARNYGWHIMGIGGNTNAIRFLSREYATDPTLRPKLTIVYTQAGQ
jgi:hypothetical protein